MKSFNNTENSFIRNTSKNLSRTRERANSEIPTKFQMSFNERTNKVLGGINYLNKCNFGSGKKSKDVEIHGRDNSRNLEHRSHTSDILLKDLR